MQITTRITRLTVRPEGEPIFSEMATQIEIDDEAAGEFILVTQQREHGIAFEPREWPAIREAIDTLIQTLPGNGKTETP
jgi:hypothetical protein